MSEFSRTSAPPAPYHSFPDAAHLPLPHPFLDHTDHPLGDVARLLYLGNAVLQDVAIGPLHRTRRVPPSHGASHPFDLVLSLGEPWVHTPGTFYYNPDTHHLVSLSGLPDADAHAEFVAECLGSTGAKGAVSVAFHLEVRRIQWRYRTSTAYPTIFLDLGHLVETLAYVARDMDWAMTHIPVAFQPPLAALEYTFGPIMGLCQLHPANGNTHERPEGE
jgi:SagB-type dehydrogenase family enzyme